MELCGSAASIAPKSRFGSTNLQLLFPGQPQVSHRKCVFQDSQGRTWLGTSGQGLYYWQDGRLNQLSDPAIESSTVFALAEDRRGRIWVGTHAGLLCYGSDLQRERGRFTRQ